MNKNMTELKKILVGITIILLPISVPIFAAPTPPEAPTAPRATVEEPVDSTTVIPEVIPEESSQGLPDPVTEEIPMAVSEDPEENLLVSPELTTEDSLQSDMTNTETGQESINESEEVVENELELKTENESKVDNNVELEANTGDNEASYNTGNGSVETGDANVVLTILNLINTVFIGKDGGEIGLLFDQFIGDLIGDYIIDPNTGEAYSLTGSRLDIGNNNTGAGSTNSSYINLGNTTEIENNNDGTALNKLDVSANTGNNKASYNTGNGSVISGDANVSLNVLNFLNSTFIATGQGLVGILNVFGNFVGNLVIPNFMTNSNSGSSTIAVSNEDTGANSENNSNINVNNSLDIDNDNQADISNDLELTGTTGNNESSYNTGSGRTDTGNVNVDVNVNNVANQNIIGDTIFYTIINVLGEWTGANLLANLFESLVLPNPSGEGQTIILKNKDTGANSTNNSTLNIDNEINITNNNVAEIDNKVAVDANTGGNKASYNTGNGSVDSGNVNILTNFLNLANVNVMAHKFVFFVVNIFGDWKGDISDEKSIVDESSNNNVTINNGKIVQKINEIYTVNNNSDSQDITFSSTAHTTSGPTIQSIVPDSHYILGANDGLGFENDNGSLGRTQGFVDNYSWLILFILGIFIATCAYYTYKWQLKREQIDY